MELNQEIAVEMLSITGVQVEVADNGAEAVKKFEASPEGYFDLIFMDIQMPVMNGYDATKRIRQLSRSDAESVWIVAMLKADRSGAVTGNPTRSVKVSRWIGER